MPVPYAIETVKTAIGCFGMTEQPKGSNKLPPKLREICERAGYPGPCPWCLFFALGCARTAIQGPMPGHLAPEGSCSAFLAKARAAGKVLQTPSFGAIAIFLDPRGKPFHAGVYVGDDADDPTHCWHVEGNTNDVGSAEGYAVCLRRRAREDTRWVVW